MRKSDLKNGMIVEYRNGKRRLVIGGHLSGIDHYNPLSFYNEDLTNKKYKDLDIVIIYDSDGFDGSLKELLTTAELTLVWERKEVNWSKVPFGTRVRVWDRDMQDKYEGLFLEYVSEDDDYPFRVYSEDIKDEVLWECCELA